LILLLSRAVETGVAELEAEDAARPAEMGLEDLADVHARRDAERVRTISTGVPSGRYGMSRGKDAGDDPLVAVAAGHLVADVQLALIGDVDLDQLDDAGASSSPLRSWAIFSS